MPSSQPHSQSEFEEDSEHFWTYLQSYADKLNSNEEFEPDDSFIMEMTLIRTPGRGGAPQRHNKLGRVAIEKVLDTKRSVVHILNDDELCCARAIVTMKAFAELIQREILITLTCVKVAQCKSKS